MNVPATCPGFYALILFQKKPIVVKIKAYLVVLIIILAGCSSSRQDDVAEFQRKNDSLSRQLSEKSEEVFLLRDSIKMARLRDSVMRADKQ